MPIIVNASSGVNVQAIREMIGFIKKWFRGHESDDDDRMDTLAPVARPTPKPAAKPARTDPADAQQALSLDPAAGGRIESNGPGKNVLIRNKYQREDTGTHETLKIVDDSIVDSGEETGIDPYNTGNFDRSKNWDKRFRN